MFTQNPRLHTIQDNLFRVKTALDHTSDAIQIVNELGKSLYHNKVFINLFAYTVDQLNEAGGVFAVFAEQDIPRQILADLEEKSYWNGPVKIYSLSGELKSLYLRVYKVTNNHSKSVGNICIFNEKNLNHTFIQTEKNT